MRAPALLTTAFAMLLFGASTASAQQTAPSSDPMIASPAPAAAPAAPAPSTGGAAYGEPNPATVQAVPGAQATLLPNGMAAAPASAPQAVKDAIAAANRIVGKPYRYGGGHTATFRSRGYDCSGTVSFALRGGELLDAPLDSRAFMRWGDRGVGQWITIYTNPGHAFVVIAGLRLDTSAAGDPSGLRGPRWRPTLRKTKGFRARHPLGL